MRQIETECLNPAAGHDRMRRHDQLHKCLNSLQLHRAEEQLEIAAMVSGRTWPQNHELEMM